MIEVDNILRNSCNGFAKDIVLLGKKEWKLDIH